MKSNGPTRRDKFAWARAKLEDVTKKKKRRTRRRGGRREGERGEKRGGGKCLWLVCMTAF